MKSTLLTLFAILFSISLFASDTTTVRIHDHTDMTWYGNYDEWGELPDATLDYRKVYLHYTMGCATGGCSDWDYTSQIFVRYRTGAIDSTLQTAPLFTVNGTVTDSIHYNSDSTYFHFWDTTNNTVDSALYTHYEIIEFNDGEKTISIEPNADSLTVDFQLVYSNKVIGKQRNKINFSNRDLVDVYSSRTFCLFEDIEKIKKIGLAKGGSLENAVVVKNNSIANAEGLRNKKEFVNHKILDLAGDFLLSGYRILGSVKCVQGGHSLSNLFLRAIFKDQSNFVKIETQESISTKTYFKTSINKLAINA